MSHIFISYSRRDIDFAGKIVQALADNKLDTWIDWKSIPKGEDWEQEIYRGIEEADAFLFLISPDSVASQMCNKEIERAVKNGKRILPIVIRDADPKNIHPEISKRNWIFCRDGQDDFNKAIEETRKTIHTDYGWLKYHTELQIKALKWERKQDASRLLRGKELREAEQKLAEISSQEDPQPTKLQRKYILASQRNEVRTRRQIAIGLVVGLGIMAMLSFVAWGQRNEARAQQSTAQAASTQAIIQEAIAKTREAEAQLQANISRAQELAAQSKLVQDEDFQRSILLGVEAFNKSDTVQSRSALFDNLINNPKISQYLIGHSQGVTNVAFSPDGKILASSSMDKTIILWDVEKKRIIGKPLTAHTNYVYAVAFSPDGKTLASGGMDKTIILWDVKSHNPIGQPLTDNSDYISSLVFSPDGKILTSGNGDGKIIFWDISKRQRLGTPLLGHTDSIIEVVFSPNGKLLASSSWDRNIIFWDVEKRTRIGNPLTTTSPLWGIAFSPNGKILVSGNNGGKNIFWNTETFQPIQTLQVGPENATVANVAFSPDGKILIASHDEKVFLIDIDKNQIREELPVGISDGMHRVIFNPDGKTIAAASMDKSVILWDISQREIVSQTLYPQLLNEGTFYPSSIAFTPDGNKMVTSAGDGIVILWDIGKQRPSSQVLIKYADIHEVAFSPDGETLAAVSLKGTIYLWDVNSNIPQPVKQFANRFIDRVIDFAFSLDGHSLALAGCKELKDGTCNSGLIIIWDLGLQQETGLLINPLESLFAGSVAFSPDGKILASGFDDGSIVLWDINKSKPIGQPLYDTPYVNDLSNITYSPDGKILAAGYANSDIILWDVESRSSITMPSPPTGFAGHVNNIAFSPDGKLLASGYENGSIIIWDTDKRQSIGQPLVGGADHVLSVAFNSDGKMLASGVVSNDVINNQSAIRGNIILWDIDPQSWIGKTCQRVGRNLTQAEWQQYFLGEEYRLTCPQWPAGE